MKPRLEFRQISLEAWWRRALAATAALAVALLLAGEGARHAAAHLPAGDLAALHRALSLDPDNAELQRELARRALASLDLPLAMRSYRAALRLNRYQPEAWLEYSFVCEAQGELAAARSAVREAVALAPASAHVLEAAGNFFVRRREWDSALGCFQQALLRDLGAAAAVFEVCWKWAPDRAQILSRALPRTVPAAEAYLRFLVNRAAWEEAARAWQWARQWGQAPGQPSALHYVNGLLAARRPAEARRVWEEAFPPTDPGNLIYNAGFQQKTQNGGFDWLLSPAPGVELAYDTPTQGRRALAVRFSGRDNPDYWHLRQPVAVRPGTSYRLGAAVRGEAITSSSGPRLEVRDGYSEQLLAASEPVLGSIPWQRRVVEFRTGPATELVKIGVRRPAAPPWDEPIGGTLWLRDLNLQPADSRL